MSGDTIWDDTPVGKLLRHFNITCMQAAQRAAAFDVAQDATAAAEQWAASREAAAHADHVEKALLVYLEATKEHPV